MGSSPDIRGRAAGAPGPWLELFNEHYPALCAHAQRIVGCPADAEDVVQTVLCLLWRRHGRLCDVQAVRPFLLACVRNRARNFVRARAPARRLLVVSAELLDRA